MCHTGRATDQTTIARGHLMPEHMENVPTYHVLALSGGGYRGLYTATILSQLEDAIGGNLASRFDLICGTSVGGILALGLAAEIPAARLKQFFLDHGTKIFDPRKSNGKFSGFLHAKHSSSGLKAVLEEQFNDSTIGNLTHRVMIPTVNYTTGMGQFFKTPHHPSLELDHRMTLVDVALATTAAPVYFPLSKNNRGVFADGGLVGNAPGLFGLHEIKHFVAPSSPAKIRVLSIGTMTLGATIRGGERLDRGILQWKNSLFDLVISAQGASVDFMLKHELRDDYFKIDDMATPDQSKDIQNLDVASEAATNTLLARGMSAAQNALGDSKFAPFRTHIAATPTFYHGPNANHIQENTHAQH